MVRRPMIADPVAAHNERIKLVATSINAIGVGLIGFALLRPLTEDASRLTLMSALWTLSGVAFHGVAHYVLRSMRREASDDVL